MRSVRPVVIIASLWMLACGSSTEDDADSGGAFSASTGSVSGTGTGAAGASTPSGGSASGGAGTGAGGATGGTAASTGGFPASGGLALGGVSPATGGASTGGTDPSTGGAPTGGADPSTGGAPTGGADPSTGGAPTGGTDPSTGGAPTGGTDPGTGGAGGAGTECPYAGRITYTLNQADNPSADELDAYARLTAAMDEALAYYNCYADLEKQLWVNYDPGVPTAQANIDGWMSFGNDRAYMVLPTAMHEIAHTLGVGYYGFGNMTDSNGIWTGANANAILASIDSPRDTQLHADAMHFWPYGLNYASEYENEDDLIIHVRIVAAIRTDLGQ